MENNTENENTGTIENSAAGAAVAVAGEKDFKWNFGGKDYDLFLVNGTGGIGLPIVNPNERDKVMGVIGAIFAWENREPFLDFMDVETIDKAKKNDDWTERENEALMLRNAKLFSEIIQSGYSYDIDELGDKHPAKQKTRAEMLKYRKVVQSDLVSKWLNEFHIERWMPEGMSGIDAYLQNVDEVYFTCRIGDYHNPRHLLFFTFGAPTDEQISAYQKDTFKRGQNTEGDWRYRRENETRLRFARKHFRSVKGAMLGPKGNTAPDASELRTFAETDDQALSQFKEMFNPEWFVRLADELAAAFSLGKK